jgi:Ser/Thr protein kinase RdoA (MazF antagonist)
MATMMRRMLGRSVYGVPDSPSSSTFKMTLARMYRRQGVDTLPAHLADTLGTAITRVQQLDVGVFRVDRRRGPPLVARLFSSLRPETAVHGDLEVLELLQMAPFPAERPFGPDPLSTHQGQLLLVTEFVRSAAKSALPAGDPIMDLGALVGRLHRSLRPTGAADRPSGALHHYSEGTLADELKTAGQWLHEVEPQLKVSDHDAFETLGRALAAADAAAGLPEAFIHPDPVPKNAVFTTAGPVLVDWAGAGRGPRLVSLALVLRSGWAGPRFVQGYASEVELTSEERVRAPEILMTRALIDVAFRVCREPSIVRQQVKRIPSLRRRSVALATTALGDERDAPM